MKIFHVTCGFEVEDRKSITLVSNKSVFHSLDQAKEHIQHHLRLHNKHLKPDEVPLFYRCREIDTERVPNWEKMFPVHEGKRFTRHRAKSVARNDTL